jgi:DNA modification methylase
MDYDKKKDGTANPGNPTSRRRTSPWQSRIVSYDLVDARELTDNPSNFRKHPQTQHEALIGSLNDLGWIAPVIVNRLSGHLVDGHLRARLAGEHKSPLPVAYVELSDEEEKEALLALDPIAAMAVTDKERLGELLGAVRSEQQGITELLERLANENNLYRPRSEDPGPDLDHADELQTKWQVRPGEIFHVGAHRLMCADVTDQEAVARLLTGGPAKICFTDPPWNVAYGETRHPTWRKRSIANDNLGERFPAFVGAFCRVIADSLLPGASLYLVMSAQEWPTVDYSLRETGFHWSSTIVWAKDRPVLSRKDYHTQYEPVWYGWKEGAPRLAPLRDRTQSDLWQIPRPARSEDHPTQKPVELVSRALRNSSHPGDVVFDPFLGSGTTAVAAEATGRACFALELEPKYVAVSLERLCGMGLAPRRLEA